MEDIPILLERIPPFQSTTWLALHLDLDPSGFINRLEVLAWYSIMRWYSVYVYLWMSK